MAYRKIGHIGSAIVRRRFASTTHKYMPGETLSAPDVMGMRNRRTLIGSRYIEVFPT